MMMYEETQAGVLILKEGTYNCHRLQTCDTF